MPARPIALARKDAAPLKARGAVSNAAGRYERESRQAIDDGWSEEAPPDRLDATVMEEKAATIIARNNSPDISFDRSINPYRGCEHGCVYCYARPNHAYVGLSPGLDFETRLFAKSNAVQALIDELSAPGYRPATIMLSGVTDPYQPIERQRRLTRDILQTLLECRHPVSIITKSALILRDLDILRELARENLVKAALSITTLDPVLARRMEPRAASPARRLAAIQGLAEAGVPVTVMMAPIIPGLNDQEIEPLLKAARDAGAQAAGYVLLRLPLELKALVREWLDLHVPERADRIWKLIEDTRGGALYQSEFGLRQRGSGPYATLIAQRFRAAIKRNGFAPARFELDAGKFRPPVKPGDQLSLWT